MLWSLALQNLCSNLTDLVVKLEFHYIVARQAYDNVFGLSIMIFTASLKITSLPIDINRLDLLPSLALNFVYMTNKEHDTCSNNIIL